MKITIENEWPGIGDNAPSRKVITIDTCRWDDSLADAVEAMANALKAYGFSADRIDRCVDYERA
jgi:hypothetical protein